jgi:hypothetical protein
MLGSLAREPRELRPNGERTLTSGWVALREPLRYLEVSVSRLLGVDGRAARTPYAPRPVKSDGLN